MSKWKYGIMLFHTHRDKSITKILKSMEYQGHILSSKIRIESIRFFTINSLLIKFDAIVCHGYHRFSCYKGYEKLDLAILIC